MADFDWPWQYNFPPFFTLQPNIDTRKKQVEAWCALVLSYHKCHKTYSLDVIEALASPLCSNKKLDRKISSDFLYTILDELRKTGHVEWKDKGKKQCLVMWRSPNEWGKLIYSWISTKSMTNTVCTFYEITEDSDASEQEFFGLEKWLLLRALRTLEADGNAELFTSEGQEGVKFF